MRFKIEKLSVAEKEYSELTDAQRKILDKDFETIETIGIEFVKRRFLRNGILKLKVVMLGLCLNIKKMKLSLLD